MIIIFIYICNVEKTGKKINRLEEYSKTNLQLDLHVLDTSNIIKFKKNQFIVVIDMTPRVGRGEWDSNPRVLSNMGLAIPRPTRLGDPRSKIVLVRNILLFKK